ncbi:MAG: UDP-N-acetylmuramoylalanyl-D-glutamyl-2, 6-diaminopimelate--D-alanyl-D-alanine ligase, partial [Actinobacteria bacterium]|nr:UDP-N-acetylmuramoylalanyl-D-glutamyl-2, 6-diaminopimelate--D-alanyl-D-alanine ligase [Actinomycetota bacterium]
MERDACFVALRAERDGHDFVAAAHAAGAAVAIVDHVVEGVAGVGDGSAVLQIVVPDTIDASGRDRPRRSGPPGGAGGRRDGLGRQDIDQGPARGDLPIGRPRNRESERPPNNGLGPPLTPANADPAPLRVVVEMAQMRGAGHIRHLCEIADPTVGVVTSVAAAHTEAFGDLAAIAAAKGELVEWLPATGTAVLNADDPAVAAMAARTAGG